mmetsp:Transcript_133590/g.260129  ORF Transcript_133590/g.260129 Transcript_133590/m.260129 type:complete len:82 (+) Transcript_133590:430-675(+)
MLHEEKITLAYCRALLKLALCLVKVNISVKGQQESRDWVSVATSLMVHDPDCVPDDVLQALVQDEACANVAEEVWARQGDD